MNESLVVGCSKKKREKQKQNDNEDLLKTWKTIEFGLSHQQVAWGKQTEKLKKFG